MTALKAINSGDQTRRHRHRPETTRTSRPVALRVVPLAALAVQVGGEPVPQAVQGVVQAALVVQVAV